MNAPAAPPSPPPITSRPRPLLTAVRSGSWISLLGTVLSVLASVGLLSGTQASVLDDLLAAILPLLTAGTAALHVFHVLRTAEPKVTPLVDPRSNAGEHLLPAGTR